MWTIHATSDISSCFKGIDCTFDLCFNVHHLFPTSLSRNFKWRDVYGLSVFGQCLYRSPYLINLAERELSLVQQDKMLIEVVVIKQNIAVRFGMNITTCSSCFLKIVLQRVGNVIMNHKSNIALVYAHAESRCSDDDSYLVVDEVLLVPDLCHSVHLAMESPGVQTIISQLLCYIFC